MYNNPQTNQIAKNKPLIALIIISAISLISIISLVVLSFINTPTQTTNEEDAAVENQNEELANSELRSEALIRTIDALSKYYSDFNEFPFNQITNEIQVNFVTDYIDSQCNYPFIPDSFLDYEEIGGCGALFTSPENVAYSINYLGPLTRDISLKDEEAGVDNVIYLYTGAKCDKNDTIAGNIDTASVAGFIILDGGQAYCSDSSNTLGK